VSFHRNALARPTSGWQIQPVFQVLQHQDHVDVLDALVRFFGVGAVRRKSQANPVLVYTVYNARRLLEYISPFFEQYPCESNSVTSKRSPTSFGRSSTAVTIFRRSSSGSCVLNTA
jgi:hypothetical protein